MRNLLLGLAVLALALTCAPAISGTLVTNDGSFAGSQGCTVPPAVIPTLTINSLTQVIAAPAIAGQAIHICQWDYGVQAIVGSTGVYLSYGTGMNCGTTNVTIDSAALFDGASATAGDFVSPWAVWYITAPANTAICILQNGTSGTLTTTGTIKYAIF